jgi:hypothetical protein
VVHGHQQLSLFNAHHDERCFSPIHVYDAASGQCIVIILRRSETPDGEDVYPSPGHSTRLCLANLWPALPICAVWRGGSVSAMIEWVCSLDGSYFYIYGNTEEQPDARTP